MPNIDADTHVIESSRTWDYLEGADQAFRPVPTLARAEDGTEQKFWLVAGQLVSRIEGPTHQLSGPVREMEDLEGRLRHMDEMGVDVQMLYPSFFLGPPSILPEVERALCRSYNRWLADIYGRSEGRLRWAVVPPLLSMPEALSELEFGKQHGACGVFLRGIEGSRMLADEYFFPLYQKASDLNMPLCIHAGNGSAAVRAVVGRDLFVQSVLPVLGAFNGLVTAGIPERFPALRIGFVEGGADWIPYLVREARRRHERIHTPGAVEDETTAMLEKRLYVTCLSDDDLEHIIGRTGSDTLLIGTDFGHGKQGGTDVSAELNALDKLRRREDLDPAVLHKMLNQNPSRFYGL